jgi:hypothetical protein
MLRDSLKELNTNSERLTSIHDSGINPSFRGARLRANPESRGNRACVWIPGSRLRRAPE